MNKVDNIIKNIEKGVQEIFTSDRYLNYLNTLSKFHHYSLNNTLLINMQYPNASLVASYTTWKKSFNRQVKVHEKAIKIIVPYIKKKTQLNEMGESVEEETILGYRIGNVFDYNQTEGDELPTLSCKLEGKVDNYDKIISAIIKASKVKIIFEKLEDNIDGFFNKTTNEIHIRDNMSEVQTINALIHELTHAYMHTGSFINLLKDTNTQEVEAESVSYVVCKYFDIETKENSFAYIATWSKDKNLSELKSSLDTISEMANEFINKINKFL